MKKALSILLAFSLLLSALAGCGKPAGADSSNPPAQNSDSGGTPSAPAVPEKKEGGRLTISAATPTTRAWYDVRGIMAIAMFGYVYETWPAMAPTAAPSPSWPRASPPTRTR